MGCDIHMFAERRKDKKWEMIDEQIFPDNYKEGEKTSCPYSGRNYTFFALLADVRNGYGFAGIKTGEPLKPISSPKGIPDDASPEYKKACDDWDGDGHSHSWFTVKELKEADWDQKIIKCGVVPIDVYEYLKEHNEKPKSWSGEISGKNIVTITEEQYKTLSWNDRISGTRFYVQMWWEDSLREYTKNFLEKTMPILEELGAEEDIRIVFFFDN